MPESEVTPTVSAKIDLKKANEMLMKYENNFFTGKVPPDQIDFAKERIAYWGSQVTFFQKIVYGD